MAVMVHTRRWRRRLQSLDVFAHGGMRVSSGTVRAGGRAVRARAPTAAMSARATSAGVGRGAARSAAA